MTDLRQKLENAKGYTLLLIIGTFPALSVIVDGYGSALWYFLGLLGIMAFGLNASVRKTIYFEPKVLFFIAVPFLFFLWSIII